MVLKDRVPRNKQRLLAECKELILYLLGALGLIFLFMTAVTLLIVVGYWVCEWCSWLLSKLIW